MTTANFLYVAEVSSKQHRSMLSSLGSINVSFGLLIVYTLGLMTTWQKSALIASSFSVLTALAMLKAGVLTGVVPLPIRAVVLKSSVPFRYRKVRRGW